MSTPQTRDDLLLQQKKENKGKKGITFLLLLPPMIKMVHHVRESSYVTTSFVSSLTTLPICPRRFGIKEKAVMHSFLTSVVGSIALLLQGAGNERAKTVMHSFLIETVLTIPLPVGGFSPHFLVRFQGSLLGAGKGPASHHRLHCFVTCAAFSEEKEKNCWGTTRPVEIERNNDKLPIPFPSTRLKGKSKKRNGTFNGDFEAGVRQRNSTKAERPTSHSNKLHRRSIGICLSMYCVFCMHVCTVRDWEKAHVGKRTKQQNPKVK